jgi:hypothetical protein
MIAKNAKIEKQMNLSQPRHKQSFDSHRGIPMDKGELHAGKSHFETRPKR